MIRRFALALAVSLSLAGPPSELLCGLLSGRLAAADSAVPHASVPGDPLHWYDAKNLDVEGRGYTEVKEFYDRFPAKAEGVVRPPVWGLSRNSSGMCVWFDADTPSIAVRW